MSRITCQRHEHVYGSQGLHQSGTISVLNECTHFLKGLPGWNLPTLSLCTLSQGCCFFPPVSPGCYASSLLPAQPPAGSSQTLLNLGGNSFSGVGGATQGNWGPAEGSDQLPLQSAVNPRDHLFSERTFGGQQDRDQSALGKRIDPPQPK